MKRASDPRQAIDHRAELSLPEHAHRLETANGVVGGPLRLEPAHRPDPLLQLAMVGLEPVVQVLFSILPDAAAILALLPDWIEDYCELPPSSSGSVLKTQPSPFRRNVGHSNYLLTEGAPIVEARELQHSLSVTLTAWRNPSRACLVQGYALAPREAVLPKTYLGAV